MRARRRASARGAGLLALLVAGLAVLTPLRAEPLRFVITAEEMTAEATRRFPVRQCALLMACVTLSDPVVSLVAGDDRIRLTTRVTPELGVQAFDTGEIDIAGKPRYDPGRGAFFLDDAKVIDSRFPGLSPSQARTASDLASGFLAQSLRDRPLYVLDESDARQALARLVLSEVRVENGKLHLLAGDGD